MRNVREGRSDHRIGNEAKPLVRTDRREMAVYPPCICMFSCMTSISVQHLTLTVSSKDERYTDNACISRARRGYQASGEFNLLHSFTPNLLQSAGRLTYSVEDDQEPSGKYQLGKSHVVAIHLRIQWIQ